MGQAYAFLVVWLFADNWVGIVVCLALLSFVSAFVLQKDLGWGIALCLAGTVMNFLLIKQQVRRLGTSSLRFDECLS